MRGQSEWSTNEFFCVSATESRHHHHKHHRPYGRTALHYQERELKRSKRHLEDGDEKRSKLIVSPIVHSIRNKRAPRPYVSGQGNLFDSTSVVSRYNDLWREPENYSLHQAFVIPRWLFLKGRMQGTRHLIVRYTRGSFYWDFTIYQNTVYLCVRDKSFVQVRSSINCLGGGGSWLIYKKRSATIRYGTVSYTDFHSKVVLLAELIPTKMIPLAIWIAVIG